MSCCANYLRPPHGTIAAQPCCLSFLLVSINCYCLARLILYLVPASLPSMACFVIHHHIIQPPPTSSSLKEIYTKFCITLQEKTRPSAVMTSRIKSDITLPVCVVLLLVVYWLGRPRVHASVCESLFLPACTTIGPPPASNTASINNK